MARQTIGVLLIGSAFAMVSCGDGSSINHSKRGRPSQAFWDYVEQFSTQASCDAGKRPGCAQLEIISSAYRGSLVLKALQVECEIKKQEPIVTITNSFSGTETLHLTFFVRNWRGGTQKCGGPGDTSCRLEGFIQEKPLMTNNEQYCFLNIYDTKSPPNGEISCEKFSANEEKISIVGESRFTCPM